MTHQMILNRKYKSVGIQTGDESELFIYFTNKKTARVYFSTSYKDIVLSFNFGTSKSFIITRSMWKTFLLYFNAINTIFNNQQHRFDV